MHMSKWYCVCWNCHSIAAEPFSPVVLLLEIFFSVVLCTLIAAAAVSDMHPTACSHDIGMWLAVV